MYMKILILAVFLASTLCVKGQDDIIKVGDKLPAFNYVLDGVSGDTDDFTNKFVWINFFATWCPPCRAELQFIQSDLYSKYKDNHSFQFIAVGYGHTIEQIRSFQSENGLYLPFVADQNLTIFGLFAKGVIPRNYLVNRQGIVIYSGDGYNKEEFEKHFQLVENELGI